MRLDHEYEGPGPHRGRKGRRPLIVAGAVGLAAVLGGGAYAVTTVGTGEHRSTVARDASPVGVPGAVSESPSGMEAEPAPIRPQPARTPSRKALPPSVQARVDQARAAASRAGHPVQHPPAPPAGHVAAAETGPVHERMAETAEGKIKIISAMFDLAGRRELLLAADKGIPVGDARCTHRVRFSSGAKPREIPNLLLCWRTSPSRSVVTMASARKGRLSAAASVTAIDTEWAKLR
jgi:hypothetical protein